MLFNCCSKNDWEMALQNFGEQIFWKKDYYDLFNKEGVAEAAYYKSKNGFLFYPYLKRELKLRNEVDQSSEILFDISTAYGYGGPLIKFNGDKNQRREFVEEFYLYFHQYCRKAKIVSEFVRFHPIEADHESFRTVLDVKQKNQNIVVPVKEFKSPEQALSHYKHNTRKSIKKALRNNVKIIIDHDGEYFSDFYDIYTHTLRRNLAHEKYYLNKDFFSNLNKLGNHFVYFHAVKNQKIIASELILYDSNYLYSFLGGTFEDYFKFSPNHLLKHQVVLWAMEKDIPLFMLGGGRKQGDNIYKYKKTFSPQCNLSFFTGEKIILSDQYEKLCNQNNPQRINRDYFPQYRVDA